jgi:hypothetical protein
MGGSAASVSNVEVPRYANMDVSAASVSNVEGPRYANMGVSAADVRRRFMNTGTNEEGHTLIAYQPYWMCHIWAVPTSGFSGLRPCGQLLYSINEGGNLQVHVMLHCIEKAPILGPNFTCGRILLGHGHGRHSGLFDLNEFTQMIVNLYHNKERAM